MSKTDKFVNFLEDEVALTDKMLAGYEGEPGEPGPYAYGPGFEKGCYVICPKCGRQVPSGYECFTSKEEADKYALENCECTQEGKNDFEAVSLLPSSFVDTGVCRFCGQAQNVGRKMPQMEADEYASRHCYCAGGSAYRGRLEAEERRSQDLAAAEDLIDELFGSSENRERVSDEAIEMLKAGAALVYDRKILNQSLTLSYTIRAKIARSSKGNLTIERKDSSSSKMEV